MLVLTLKVGEKLLVGDDVVVNISRTMRNNVTLAIDAPKKVNLRRIKGEERG
jgi:carbon storage regulator